MKIINELKQWSKQLKDEFLINGKIHSRSLVRTKLKREYPELMRIVNEQYNGAHKEIIYALIMDIDEIPHCPICGKPNPLRNYVKGFQITCSTECAHQYLNIPERKEKANAATKKRADEHNYYITQGKEYVSHGSRITIKNYCKHGDVTIGRSVVNKLLEGVSYCLECNRELYESYNPTDEEIFSFREEFPEFYKKHSQALNKTWWLRYYPKYLKIIDVYFERYFGKIIDDNYGEAYYVFLNKMTARPKCKEKNCEGECYFHRPANTYSFYCQKHKVGYNNSVIEQVFEEFIQTLNIDYIHNDRTVLNGTELDFYFPTHNLAIEFNGTWFHCDKFKPNDYHSNKYNTCKSKGIQLLTVWEDTWRNKPDIIKSIIKAKLGIFTHRIYARNCKIKQIDYHTAKDFINTYHLQGDSLSTWRYGLFYNDELVSVMTFGKSRFKKPELELIRYCVKSGYQIIGGTSKLYSHFVKEILNLEYPDYDLVSYADCDISSGTLYEKLGMTYVHTTENWTWFYKGDRYNRLNSIRHTADEELYKCYGTGTMKYKR